jgi:hypothetical protein
MARGGLEPPTPRFSVAGRPTRAAVRNLAKGPYLLAFRAAPGNSRGPRDPPRYRQIPKVTGGFWADGLGSSAQMKRGEGGVETTVELVKADADEGQEGQGRPWGRGGSVDVALAGDVGAGVAAAHRHNYVGLPSKLERQRLPDAQCQARAWPPRPLDGRARRGSCPAESAECRPSLEQSMAHLRAPRVVYTNPLPHMDFRGINHRGSLPMGQGSFSAEPGR